MKHIKHYLITTAISLCCFVANAYDFQVNGVKYNITSSTNLTVEVTCGSLYDLYSGSVTIPSSVTYNSKMYRVTSIGECAFWCCSSLTFITIPASVTSIGETAFAGCSSLTSITIPEGVTSIGFDAFSGCSSLTSITIPEGVTSIGAFAFSDCSSLTSIPLPGGVTSIEQKILSGCSSLTSITIPESVMSIGYKPFDGCSSLTSITCKSITPPECDAAAFSGVDRNIPVYVPAASVSAYQSDVYWNRFTNIQPDGIVSGECGYNLVWTFTRGELIIEGTGAMNNYYQAPWSDYCESIKEVTIKDGVTSIGNSAFEDCSGLTSITISASVTSIGMGAFSRCNSLTTISLPENSQLTSIGMDAFSRCNSLTTISLPENSQLTSIGNSAFEDCSGLTSITISASVTSIGWGAFSGCNSLAAITIPASVTSIGRGAFSGCNSLAAITVEEGNTVYDSRNGCNAIIETSTNTLIAGCPTTVIPESVTSIGNSAFEDCSGLTSITIPENVTSIGHSAFAYCDGLTSITIPENVTSIGHSAFLDCEGLTSITIPENVTSIGEGAFAYCDGLTSITIPENVTSIGHSAFRDCSSLTSITIPESMTSIGESAFQYCNGLTSITLPASVTSIGSAAFRGCEGLTSITCKSTTPPVCESSNTFYDVEKSIPVYVPASSISAYQAADYWKEFTNIQAIATDVLATSLTLDVTEASLAPDETLTLTATLLPEDATNPTLTWTSSNEKVATVDEYGVVTAVADGEATITVSTTDGSNLSATCVVTVETKEAEGDVTDYDNMIYFEDATAFVNTTVTLPLQMTNSASITAVQFDVYLPEGVTIEKTSRGKYNVTFNEDRADNTTHTLSSALQDDGAVRVLCYSTESYDFLGSEGAIFYFPLEIPEMEDGDYDVVIRNIVLTDVSGTKYEIPSMTSTMTVLNVAPGDCNADNTIDVADIVVLANHILGTTADGFVEKAADYNADGAVDVADIVNIANYILNGNHAGARALVREVVSTRAAAAGYSLDILPFVLDAEGSKTIALELTDPTESFTAFQCDLYLPEGISIETNNRGKYKFSFNEERTEAAYHTLSGSLQADGAVRMLCYSTDSEVFLGTEGALIYIPLTADASLAVGVYEFSIAGTVLTYQDGVKVTPDTYKGSIVVGDGGEVQEVKLYGRYTSEVLGEYSTVLAANSCITSVDLTEAINLPEDGLLTTGNPNTIVYLAEGDALSNACNVVTGDECAGLVLTDGYAFAAPVAFSASQASYGRELAEGKYGTIVLPYAPDTDDYVFYALTSAGDDVLVFDEVETPAANTPYLYKLRDGKSATRITGNEVAVSSELTPAETAAWQMVGSYANRTIAADEDGDRYYYAYTSSDNKIHRVTNTLTVKPYRAYFTTASTVGTQLAIRTRGGEETLIDVTEVDGLCPEVYYDLSGRRVDNPVEGVYIVNGKKVVF